MDGLWQVKRPEHLLTGAMERTIAKLGLTRITGWAKKEGGAVEFTSGLDAHPYSREVVIGPRGGVRSDSLAEYRRQKEARERRAARAAERRHPEIGVFNRRGELIGLRIGG